MAKSLKEVEHLFNNYGATVFNFVFADDKNNIGYYAPPLIPNRKNKYDGTWRIKEGWTGENEWDGYLDFKKNPHLFNPEKGYIFTAN